MKGWKFLLLILGLIMAQSSLIFIPELVDGIGAPAVRITLHQTEQTVDVSPGSSGIVTFTGEVEAIAPYLPNGQNLIITLEADAGYWPVSVPPALIFSNEVSIQNFSISVQVPMGSSVNSQGMLSVSGRWRYSPGTLGGTIDPCTAIIKIEQYYSYEVAPRYSKYYIEEDSSGEMTFIVENEGNGPDRIALEVTNSLELEDYGVIAHAKFSDLDLPESWGAYYPVTVIIESGVLIGTYKIEVAVHSVWMEEEGKNATVEVTTGYLEVVYEGELPEPEPKPQPEPEPEPNDDEEPADDDEPVPDDDDSGNEEPAADDNSDEPSDDDAADDSPEVEDTKGNVTSSSSDGSGGVGPLPILIVVGIMILLFVLAGAYIIVRKGKKTGN